jgi:DNA-binding transcriptional MerR regulator
MIQETKNPSVSIRGASKLSGLSVHMITYLGRMEILMPSGHYPRARGRRRMFTFNDVLFLRVIADLLATGIEVKRLKQALQKAHAEAETWIDIRQAPRRFLVTDGAEVFVHRKGKLESKTVDRQFAFAFVLDLATAHRSIAAAWDNVSRKARQKF